MILQEHYEFSCECLCEMRQGFARFAENEERGRGARSTAHHPQAIKLSSTPAACACRLRPPPPMKVWPAALAHKPRAWAAPS